jgi:phosphatidylinositol-3-phosphatase
VTGDRRPSAAPAGGACAQCGSELDADQRYCLSCGTRRGPRALALQRILDSLAAPRPRPPAPPRPRGALPSPRAAAALTLALLGFGIVTGAAASNPSGQLSALRRGPLRLLVPAPAATVPAPVAPPPAEATPTPEPPAPEPPAAPASEASPAPAAQHKSPAKAGAPAAAKTSPLPPVKHVFLIVLADEPYAQTFGPESPAPYLARTLERKGELLVRYYAVAREELANEIALVSGLGPTSETAADCPVFNDILPAIAAKDGQYTGHGCVYPSAAQTIGDQLAAKQLTWRVYAEGMGDGAPPGGSSCRHPAFGAADPTSQPSPGDTFATFRDPFSYFDSVIDAPACAHDDVSLEGLSKDLKSAQRTPTLSYIVPDLCDDGRPTPCAPGAQAGLPAADAFLRRVVPEILAAPAYRHGGLLIVTTDQAPATGEYADSSSCCGQPRLVAPPAASTTPAAPTTPAGTTTTPGGGEPAGASPGSGPVQPAATTTATAPTTSQPGVQLPPSGGGQVGALLLSPYVKPGTTDQEPFNHFSLLRTIENLFGLPHLGYAALHGLSSLEASVFSAYSG